MKYLSLILISLLLLSGCKYRITCDSGFDTGWQSMAHFKDGRLIAWGDRHLYDVRKLRKNETCKREEKW